MRVLLLIALIVVASLPTLAWGQQSPTDIGGNWAEDRIDLLVRRNIIDLFPDRTFRPLAEVTRAEFIKWLVAGVRLPPQQVRISSFVDVPVSDPYSLYIETALANGLIARTSAFLPAASLRRGEAVVLAVSALGYVFEAAALASRPLPFEDTDTLPEQMRGALAVAVLADPPLLREPPSTQLRPLEPMTRAEAASLIWASLQAIEQGTVLETTTPLAAGVELVVQKRGVLRTQPIWRIQIGAFANEENAQRLASAIRERGLPVFIDFQDGFYKVRVGNFSAAAETQFAKDQLAAEGYPPWIIQTLPDFDSLPGPFRMAALIVDPSRGARLVPAFGDGQRMRRMRTSELARRAGALAAVNGGFFSLPAGNPVGCLMVNSDLVNEPEPQRSCAGITEDGTAIFDRVRFSGTLTTGDLITRLDGVNRERRTDELILYRPTFDLTTHTNQFGAEAIVTGGAVTSVVDGRGNAPIPRDGFVLSGHGQARQWIMQHLLPGTAASVSLQLTPASGDSRWAQVTQAIGGGPRLLANRQFVGGEGFPRILLERRHPRTAIGVRADGQIILLVVDGRQPYHSLGMTVFELAMELRRLGAVDAMNLDGGGSSTIIIAGQVANLPSDETGERPVANALLVLPP